MNHATAWIAFDPRYGVDPWLGQDEKRQEPDKIDFFQA